MVDIGKQTVAMNCPQCKRITNVSIQQVADEALVKCICGQRIQLKDSGGSNRKAINDINKSFKDLDRTFRNLGR